MSNIIRDIVKASEIKAGDTIEIGGILHTVCGNNIKRDPIMGISIFGMTYFENGYQRVIRVKFEVPTNNGVVYR